MIQMLKTMIQKVRNHLIPSLSKPRRPPSPTAGGAGGDRMFGRVRASPISSLEMETPPSKIIKHDSFSIYESTLLKLKQGSQCNPRCIPEDSARMDAFFIMAIDTPDEARTTDADCSSTDSLPNSSSSVQSTGSLKEQASRNMSILHFFSKYKSSQDAKNSNDEEVMVIENGYSSSSSSSSVSPTISS